MMHEYLQELYTETYKQAAAAQDKQASSAAEVLGHITAGGIASALGTGGSMILDSAIHDRGNTDDVDVLANLGGAAGAVGGGLLGYNLGNGSLAGSTLGAGLGSFIGRSGTNYFLPKDGDPTRYMKQRVLEKLRDNVPLTPEEANIAAQVKREHDIEKNFVAAVEKGDSKGGKDVARYMSMLENPINYPPPLKY